MIGDSAANGADGGAARPADPLDVALDRWVRADIITAEQAQKIRAFESGSAERSLQPVGVADSRWDLSALSLPTVPEVLGYLGGALAAVGVILAVARSWHRLDTWARVGLFAVSAIAMLAATKNAA